MRNLLAKLFFRMDLSDLADRAASAGRFSTLLDLEQEISQTLRDRLEEAQQFIDQTRADRRAFEIGQMRVFAYASDEQIKRWAAATVPDDAKAEEIARLTRMLAREQARVTELGEALDGANQQLRGIRRTPPVKPLAFDVEGEG